MPPRSCLETEARRGGLSSSWWRADFAKASLAATAESVRPVVQKVHAEVTLNDLAHGQAVIPVPARRVPPQCLLDITIRI